MQVHRRRLVLVLGSIAVAVSAVPLTAGPAQAKNCAADAVRVGTACVDKYEASVWGIPALAPGGGSNAGLIKKVQKGKATLADLTSGGATEYGTTVNDYPCAANGNDCTDAIYAVSLAGVIPSHHDVSWFQAAQACANSLKRLPTNLEWQVAALGTPDPGISGGLLDCNINVAAFAPTMTGSRTNCVSARGAFDMVGNVIEWVAEWVPISQGCGSQAWVGGAQFNDDLMCLIGAPTSVQFPGALVRGGRFESGDGARAGLYAITGDIPPTGGIGHMGFRCAREP
jgi:sulfatase-modifying factor enzyme 1